MLLETESKWLHSDMHLLGMTQERITINVSGLRFETYESTLARYPDTLLGCPMKRGQYYDSQRREYFFDRNRKAFDAILFYYQSYGRISKPDNVTEKQFVSELAFFGIGKKEDLLTFSERVDRLVLAESEEIPRNKIQIYFWKLFSVPNSSNLAGLVTFIGVFTLVLSIVITCVESLPRYLNPRGSRDLLVKRISNILNHTCYIWFTLEFVVRLVSCANRKAFFKSLLNWIDLFAILPFYLQLILESQAQMTPLSVLKILRICRIARILKVSRYSRGMRALIYTLYASRRELGLLFFILFIATVLSAALTYYAEVNADNTSLTTIPEALWWSINTITTVGYGDTYPITNFGKALGAFFSIFGTILIGLPILCLVSNFIELWESIRERTAESHAALAGSAETQSRSGQQRISNAEDSETLKEQDELLSNSGKIQNDNGNA